MFYCVDFKTAVTSTPYRPVVTALLREKSKSAFFSFEKVPKCINRNAFGNVELLSFRLLSSTRNPIPVNFSHLSIVPGITRTAHPLCFHGPFFLSLSSFSHSHFLFLSSISLSLISLSLCLSFRPAVSTLSVVNCRVYKIRNPVGDVYILYVRSQHIADNLYHGTVSLCFEVDSKMKQDL